MAKLSSMNSYVQLIMAQYQFKLKEKVIEEVRIQMEPIVQKVAGKILSEITTDMEHYFSPIKLRDQLLLRMVVNNTEIDLEELLADSEPDTGSNE